MSVQAEVTAYVREQDLEKKLGAAVNTVVRERPLDASLRIAEVLGGEEIQRAVTALATTRRRLIREREHLVRKYEMFSTLLAKAGGLPAEKVGKLLRTPSVHGTKLQVVNVRGGEMQVGAALVGRCLVMPIARGPDGKHGSTALTAALAAHSRNICEIFVGCDAHVDGMRDVFYTPEDVMHITLFQTAPPLDGDEAVADEVVQAELASVKRLAETWDPFTLEVHSVVMMPSGTLLCLLLPVPESGTDFESTRREYEAVKETDFPFAPAGLPDIFHASLARVCFGADLTEEELTRVTEACAAATAELKGTKVTFDLLWYVTDTNEAAMQAVIPNAQPTSDMRRKWASAVSVIKTGEMVSIPLV